MDQFTYQDSAQGRDRLSIYFPPPNFDYLFLYDQSSEHTKVREDGLVVSNMNVAYGGAVASMHETTVGEIGPYPSMLKVGEQQSMLFTDSCKCPFWLKYMDKVQSRIDVSHYGSQNKVKTKTKLLVDLRYTGVNTTSLRYLKLNLATMCITQNIPTTISIQNSTPGWLRSPKGMLQIIFERGYIDVSLVTSPYSIRYSKNG